MNQHRINSMLGESVGDFNGRGFFLADVREASRSTDETPDDLQKSSTSFRHFAGSTVIQANLLIGNLNSSRAMQQESLEILRKFISSRFDSSGTLPVRPHSAGSSDISGTNRPSIEINNIFSGADNLTESGRVTEVAEDLANETIAQLRAAGLRI